MRERVIFIEALAKGSPAELAAYLDAACGDDRDLRGRVDRLLAEHRREGSFILDSPPAGVDRDGGRTSAVTSAAADDEPGAGGSAFTAAEPPPDDEHPGTVIGRYKLLERIGEGGMGVVFMAQQHQPVRRRVALKVIKAGMDSRQVVARFEAERQALALMDHANIAKVLDGGATGAGRPYFVMELVQGVPITEYCDRNHLTPDQRLDLFLPVCRAVQHAHSKGIIHRDLKPSNVLVTVSDGVPVPKVIDFGIAKAAGQDLTDKTLFTQFAQMVGTPLYMSPEQAGGGADVDTRSDVYSLGVLLYELLTGSTPFDRQRLGKAAFDEVRRIIRDEEPPKPSTRIGSLTAEALTVMSAHRKTSPRKLGGVVRGELDWIVMRALEKDRSRRYETAIGLAHDVERYLADQPVHASPPSAGYRLRKFARRNKGPVLAAALVVLALLVGVAGTAWQAVRATRARAVAVAALSSETAAREQAMAALESMTDDVVEQQLAREPVLSDASRAFLRKIAAHYEGLAAVQGDTPESRYTRATGHWRLAALLAGLGEAEAAGASFALAVPLLEQLAAEFPDRPAYREALANSRTGLGIRLSGLDRHAEAATEFRQAVDLFRELAARYPDVTGYRWSLLGGRANLGNALDRLGKGLDAEAELRQAIMLGGPLAAGLLKEPDPERSGLLVGSHTNLGIVLKRSGRWGEAEAEYRRALKLQAKILDRWPDVPTLWLWKAQAHDALAQLLDQSGKLEDAEAEHREALEVLSELAADFPVVPEYRSRLARTHGSLGLLLSRSGKLEDAEAEHRRAIDINRQLAADFPAAPEWRWDLVGSRCNLAGVLQSAQRFADAEAEYQSAVTLGEQTAEEFPGRGAVRFLASSHLNLGNLLKSLGKPDKSEAAYRRAILVQEGVVAAGSATLDDWSTLALARANLGGVLTASGKLPEAEAEYRAAVKVYGRLVAEFPAAPEHRNDLARMHDALAFVMSNLGRRPDAEAEYRHAITIGEQLAAQFPETADYAVHLAGAYCNLGNFVRNGGEPAKSLEWFERAVTTLSPLAARQPPPPAARQFLRNSHWNRALALEKLGRFKEAPPDWDVAVELTDQLEGGSEAAAMFARRAMLLTRLGRPDDALADHDRAVEADPDNHWRWFQRAGLQAYARRDDAYRAGCLKMLEKFGDSDEREVGERVAKACLLADPPVGDPALLNRLIGQALAPGVPDHFVSWFGMTQGIARYRAGDAGGAVEALTAARAGMNDPVPMATADAFLAMSYQKLKRPDEARQAAHRGAALAGATEAEIDNPDGRSPLRSGDNDWLYYLVVRRQADAAVPPAAPPTEATP